VEAAQLLALIGRGEDSRLQFKENLTNADSLAGDLVAFSNGDGGRLLVGVSDRGTVVGLDDADVRRLNQLISNTSTDSIRPSIAVTTENVPIDGRIVMVVTVKEGVSKPYCDNKGVFWIKSGADKRKVASREEVQRMFQASHLVYADETPVDGTVASTDIDIRHFSEFFELRYGEPLDVVLEREGTTQAQLLENLRLAQGNALTLAGLLLFARHPQRHRPILLVKAVSFLGVDPAGTHYRDSEDIKGTLRDLFRGTMSFLTRNLHHVQRDRNFNSEGELELPVLALEELVANMLLHRDFFISAPWRVLLFDDRLEIISPGALPNNLTVENVRRGVSVARNPLLVSFATQRGELPYRGIGTGILRAYSEVPNLELTSDRERNLFIARIPRTTS